MIDMRINWPNGARVAVMLTFDFDAETLWTSRDPANARRPGTLSQGTYGAKVAVPKILEVLKEAGVKGTFFVPGWTAEHHTGRLEMIVREGHEVAHHSYSHRWIDPDFPDQEIEEMEKGLEALKRTVGVVPRGYRSPAGETSELLIRLLQQHGFLYDSSLMDDINPYRHILPDGSKGHRSSSPGTGASTMRSTRFFRSRGHGRSSPTATSWRSGRTSSARSIAGADCSTC
jgi:peptidoglycan/xylan/chitin deacetylase (PgdA/CDA1 family)